MPAGLHSEADAQSDQADRLHRASRSPAFAVGKQVEGSLILNWNRGGLLMDGQSPRASVVHSSASSLFPYCSRAPASSGVQIRTTGGL